MKINQRILTLFLACLMVFALSACIGEANTPSDDSNNSTGTSETSGEDKNIFTTNVPEKNLGGRTFMFYSANWASDVLEDYEIFSEGYNEDPINDAVYDRQIYMEETMDCKINLLPQYNSETAAQTLMDCVQSGEQNFGVLLRVNKFFSLAAEGDLYNLDDLPYCDFSQPYWDDNSYETLSVMNYHFGICGDFMLRDKNATSVLIYNKDIMADLDLEDNLYSLVDAGGWTIEVLSQYAKKGSADLNGDLVIDTNDRFGLGIWRDSLFSFMNGGDTYVAEKNEEDIPIFTLGDEKVVNYAQRVMEMIYDTDSVINAHIAGNENAGGVLESMFQANQLLFAWQKAGSLPLLRETEIEYGLLPMPKADEKQEDYACDMNAWEASCLILPSNLSDEEAYYFSIFLEEFACQGRNMIYPVYYEILLKQKVALDSESQAMVDLIFDSRVLDIGVVFNWSDVAYRFCYMTMSSDTGVTSLAKAYEQLVNKEIERLSDFILDSYS